MKLSMANIWVYHLMLVDPKIGILLIWKIEYGNMCKVRWRTYYEEVVKKSW
jgi:hypothetical protein